MDFTEIYQQTSSLVQFSPGTHFILTATQDRLVVRRTETFQITRTWLPDSSPNPTTNALPGSSKAKAPSSDSWITHIGWSCDSEYLLAARAKQGVVHVLQLRDEEWSARIDAGAEGLVKAEWAPDGRTILCFSEWGLRITIWSLVTGTATYIQFPIHPERGYAFRKDGRYFVLAERHKSKDTAGVYDATDSYKLVRHFPLPTASLASLAISPKGNHIAVWDGPLEYKLFIITLTGMVLSTFSPDPDPGFGVRRASWHPAGNFIAVTGWDEKIYILDGLSWSAISTLEISSNVPDTVKVWREPRQWLESTEGRGFLTYERLGGPQTLPISRGNPSSKGYPKSGAVQLEWNHTGSLLLVRVESMPNVVFIYRFPGPDEPFAPALRTVLIQSQAVRAAKWNPVRKGSLGICCGNSSIYTWSDEWITEVGGEAEEMAECIGVPARKFDTRDFSWVPDGKGMVLLDKDTFCCAFEVEEEAK